MNKLGILGVILIVLGAASVPVSCGVLFATSFATAGVTVLAEQPVAFGTKSTFTSKAIDGSQNLGITVIAPGVGDDVDVDVNAKVTITGTRTPTTFDVSLKRGVEGVNVYQPWVSPDAGTPRPEVTSYFWRSPTLDVDAGATMHIEVLLESKGKTTPESAKVFINGTPPFPKSVMVVSFGFPALLIALGLVLVVKNRKK